MLLVGAEFWIFEYEHSECACAQATFVHMGGGRQITHTHTEMHKNTQTIAKCLFSSRCVSKVSAMVDVTHTKFVVLMMLMLCADEDDTGDGGTELSWRRLQSVAYTTKFDRNFSIGRTKYSFVLLSSLHTKRHRTIRTTRISEHKGTTTNCTGQGRRAPHTRNQRRGDLSLREVRPNKLNTLKHAQRWNTMYGRDSTQKRRKKQDRNGCKNSHEKC